MESLQELKQKYPKIYQGVYDEGHAVGLQAGELQGMEKSLEQGRTEGRKEGQADGAKAERKRIQSVEAQGIPGHDALINALKYDGQTTGEQAAMKVLQAEKSIRGITLQNLNADAPPAVPHTDAPPPKPAQAQAVNKEAFEADSALADEFGSFDVYSAYMSATKKGLVKVLKNKEK